MATTTADLKVILILGRPGIGKGTLCKKLTETYKVCHISCGDLCRTICCDEGWELDEDVLEAIKTNQLLKDEVIVRILLKALVAHEKGGHRYFVVDGFPRSGRQYMLFEQEWKKPDLVVYLECAPKDAKNRYLARDIDGRPRGDELHWERKNLEFEKSRSELEVEPMRTGKVDIDEDATISFDRLLHTLKQHDLKPQRRGNNAGDVVAQLDDMRITTSFVMPHNI